MNKFYKRNEACKLLGVHYQTIRNLRINEKIETLKVGTRHLYNLKKYIKDNKINIDIDTEEEKENENENENKELILENKKICYCRVSSYGQKIELNNQINYMKIKYPEHEILSDIGSGINFKRKNLLKILSLAISGQLEELVISYKDRLCRISYELIEYILKTYSNTNIIIVNEDENSSPEKEVTDDLIQIITVFSSRLYGLRNYNIEKK